MARPKKNPFETPTIPEIESVESHAEFNGVVRRMRFGDVATEAEVRAVFRKGLALAAGAKGSKEYSTVMRTLLSFAKFERDLELSEKLPATSPESSEESNAAPPVRNPLAGLKVVG